MRILAVGGGSGGHVTPVVAILEEIKARHPKAKLRFWTDRRFAPQAKSKMSGLGGVRVSVIVAGKLRRYHHLSFWEQITWPKLVLLNLRDSFLVFVGFIESLFRLLVWRPDVIFTKGGYVCLPVGLAARVLGIPVVLHDSDAHPGLTNRVVGKWARFIATGAPLEYYNYPKDRSEYVGIPISSKFKKLTSSQKKEAKAQLGVNEQKPLIVVTGGGLGAKIINEAVARSLDRLNKLGSVILISGSQQYDEMRSLTPTDDPKFQLQAFVSEGMETMLGAADVVIARAGATTILELAAVQVPTILVPNAKLTGGHQLKNAKVYADAEAVKLVDEDNLSHKPELLVEAVGELLSHESVTAKMVKNFAKFARPDATSRMADIIINHASK